MKGTFKALFILFIIVTLTVLCAVSVGAEETLPSEETAEQTAAAEDEANSDMEDADAQNPFEDFYTAVLSYSSEILCLITLILSLVLTHAYRRGLVPLVKGAVHALGGAVGGLTEKADEEADRISALTEGAQERLMLIEDGIRLVTDKLEAFAIKLAELDADKTERERTSSVLLSQTEMLYDLMMTSGLPLYQKEAIGEKMAKLKEKINEADKEYGALSD